MRMKFVITLVTLLVIATLTALAQTTSTNGQFISATGFNMSLRTTVGSTVTERTTIAASDGTTNLAVNGGYVGINVPTPLHRLHVNGNVYAVGGLYTTTGAIGTITAQNVLIRTNNTDRITIVNSTGHVGMGISPTERLHVSGNSLTTGNIFSSGGNIYASTGNIYATAGSIGIGTASPSQKFHLTGGDILFDDATPIIFTGTGASELNRFLVLRNSAGNTTTSGLKAGGIVVADDPAYANPGKNDMIIKGKLFIGQATTTNTNNYNLGVKGKIGAQDLQLETTSWSDYVFGPEYKLPALSEVEHYIRKNRHLEGVPSEEEVLKDGYSVNDMNIVLLKKVEELTLYLIEQQKQIDALNKKLAEK